MRQTIEVEDGALRYRGLKDSGEFTFYITSDRSPELNGAPVDLTPGYAFQSPFLNEDWASGIVEIRKGKRNLSIDVREPNRDD